MTPDEFAISMQGLSEKWKYDKELRHITMGTPMCDLLEQLGYKEGIDIFRFTSKWYA